MKSNVFVMMSEAVDLFFYILSPVSIAPCFVKGLPRYWFAYTYAKSFVAVFVHLVYKEQHGNVYLQVQTLTDVCYAIEFF